MTLFKCKAKRFDKVKLVRMTLWKPLAILATALFFTAPLRAGELVTKLVMVEQHGCIYCDRWDSEISHIYPKTPEGKFAPLERLQISAINHSGITFERSVNFTPTFVLVENGSEVARIEGYAGEDFFWGLLLMMLKANTEYSEPAS